MASNFTIFMCIIQNSTKNKNKYVYYDIIKYIFVVQNGYLNKFRLETIFPKYNKILWFI